MIVEQQTRKTRYITIAAAIVGNIAFSAAIVRYFKMPYFNILYIWLALAALDIVRLFLASVTSWAAYYMSGKKLLVLTFKNILYTYSYKTQEPGYYDFKSYFVDVMNDDSTHMDLRLDAARNLGIMDVITSTSMQYGWQYLSAWEEALAEYKYYK